MALKWNGTTISTDNTIKFNNMDVQKVYFNGTLVWDKTSGGGSGNIEYEDCPTCGGDGEVDCPNCVVGGECTVCSGTGTATPQTCPYCESGECHVCHGSGIEPMACPNCIWVSEGQLSWPKCSRCNATGIIQRCQSCGTISGYGFNPPTACAKDTCASKSFKDSPCDRCGGLGRVDPSIYGRCLVCDGYGNYGKCSTCNGVGGPCKYCNGSHYISSGQCAVCNGTGRCSKNCNSGKLTCTNCNGSGQVIKTTREYSGASGNITMNLPSGDNLFVTFDGSYWCFSSDFDLQVITFNDIGPRHWGGISGLESEFAHNSEIYIYDFDTYSSDEYNDPSAGIYSNPSIEAEYISSFGTLKAKLSYDMNRNIWTVYNSTANTLSASAFSLRRSW